MYNMDLIINTHWDREYRWSFSETQSRLAEAVDDLIDIMHRDPKFAHFHTDSQVSMLDDYLDIRPERMEELKALVADGHILTGPWYTLPAEFLVTGEALTRNLLMGHKIARGLGKVMKAGYNIFSWGQVSQLPQLYRQFGMDAIIFYRGIDQSKLDRLEFKWRAPDGTEVLGMTFGAYHRLNFWRYVYLPYILGGNSVGGDSHQISRENLGQSYLTHVSDDELDMVDHTVHDQPCARDIAAAREGLDRLIDTVKEKSSTDELLFLQGFDQENPDPVVTELLDRLNGMIDFGQIHVASLEDFIATVERKLHENGVWDQLSTLSGEMLEVEHVYDSFGPLYNGVFSARMPIKLQNSRCEYLLSGWAEPAAAWDTLGGKPYPSVMVERAWKELLKNQQHDGIGGCHVDRVTATMDERYAVVRDIGETVVKTSLCDVTGRIDLSHVGDREIAVVLYNAAFAPRHEIVECVVDIPRGWGVRWSGDSRRDFHLDAVGADGQPVSCQMLSLDDDTVYGYLKFGNVIGYDATRCRIALEVDLPANGYTTVTVRPQPLAQRVRGGIASDVNRLENDYLSAVIGQNGTITVTDKQTGRVYPMLHYFEDCSDKGGPLRFDPAYDRGLMTTLTERPTVELVHNGTLEATYRITYAWAVPACIETDLRIHVPHGSEWVAQGMLHRAQEKTVLTIASEVTLKKDARALSFKTVVDNTAKDHRLRLMFRTGMTKAEVDRADAPYDIVSRQIAVPDSTGWYEEAARTWPTKTLVSVSDGEGTVAVYHRGLSEYEVTDDDGRAIALTLLRCFSTAGNPTETYRYQALAECLGEHTFRYELCFGAGELPTHTLWQEANALNVPVHAVQTTRHTGTLPQTYSFATVSDPRFAVTALKRAEDGDGFILRGYNESEDEIAVTVETALPHDRAELVTLEELPTGEPLTGLRFTVRPKQIVSIRLR